MASKRTATLRKEPESGIVLAFPARRGVAALAVLPHERPLPPTSARNWLPLMLVLSLAMHAGVLAATQWRMADDLARAAGSAQTAVVDGAASVIEIEVVAEAVLPSAPSPTNATEEDAKTPTETSETAAPEPEKIEPEQKIEKPTEAVQTPEPVPPTPEKAESEVVETPLPTPRVVETPENKRPPEKPKETKRSVTEAKPKPRAATSTAATPARPSASLTPGRVGNRGELEVGGPALVSSYQAQVLAHLSRFRAYPSEARSRGITGTPAVRFALGPTGAVLSVALAKSSGETLLDEAALAMVRRASPFPPFPAGLKRARMDFAAPVRFDLR